MSYINILNEYAKANCGRAEKCNWGTHMPYEFYSLDNNLMMLFCVKINGYWKLHLYNSETGEITRFIKSDLMRCNECNPTVFINNKKQYVVSYIENPDGTFRTLKVGIGKNLNKLKWKTYRETNFGSITPNYEIYADSCIGNEIVIKNIKTEKELKIKLPKYILARIEPLLLDDSKLLISMYNPSTDFIHTVTMMINLETKEVFALKLKNGDEPYKACMNPISGTVYYTYLRSKEFEDREIRETNDWSLIKRERYTILQIIE
jgi:hypothetical protein